MLPRRTLISGFSLFATAAAPAASLTPRRAYPISDRTHCRRRERENANAKAPENIEGVDLVPYLNGAKSGRPHQTLFWRQGGKSGLRHGDLKLVRMGNRRTVGNEKWELYDLSNDISEEKNLANTHPERLAELVAIWEKMNGEMQEPMF